MVKNIWPYSKNIDFGQNKTERNQIVFWTSRDRLGMPFNNEDHQPLNSEIWWAFGSGKNCVSQILCLPDFLFLLSADFIVRNKWGIGTFLKVVLVKLSLTKSALKKEMVYFQVSLLHTGPNMSTVNAQSLSGVSIADSTSSFKISIN